MKRKLDKAVAGFFYACNIAFNVADNDAFKKSLKLCALAIHLRIGNLFQISYCMKRSMKSLRKQPKFQKNEKVTLIQDDWSDVHNEPIIANCISNGRETFFCHLLIVVSIKRRQSIV